MTSCNTLENLSKMTINYCYEITITRRKTSINSGEIEDSLAYECKQSHLATHLVQGGY